MNVLRLIFVAIVAICVTYAYLLTQGFEVLQ